MITERSVEDTMVMSKVRLAIVTCPMFFLSFGMIMLLSQVDASLFDPTLIGNELQMFARDALGVDEMQVGILKANFSPSI